MNVVLMCSARQDNMHVTVRAKCMFHASNMTCLMHVKKMCMCKVYHIGIRSEFLDV